MFSRLLLHRPPFSMSSVLFSSVRIFISFSLPQSLTPSRRPSLPHLSEPSPLYFRISSSLSASLNLPSILNFSLSFSLVSASSPSRFPSVIIFDAFGSLPQIPLFRLSFSPSFSCSQFCSAIFLSLVFLPLPSIVFSLSPSF